MLQGRLKLYTCDEQKAPEERKTGRSRSGRRKILSDGKTKGERGCWSPNMMLEFQILSENKQRMKIP